MKTLSEVIENIKSGTTVATDDLLYSVLALDALITFENATLNRIASPVLLKDELPSKMIIKLNVEEKFQRLKRAYAKPPKEWVGWNNDPKNPEYLDRVEASRKIFETLVKRTQNK